MYKDYKIVVNTAAGRRRYMQYLVPYVVASPIVDRYDIWINTHNGADIEFFRSIADKFSKINLVWQPDGLVDGNKSINAFYKGCVEDKTIYFKLDDDIIWMEPDLIEKMVMFRISNPAHFLVSPLVINNSLSTYLLQIEGKIKFDDYFNADSSHPVLWRSGKFAGDLHQWFIDNYLTTKSWHKLNIGKKVMGMTRFSINAILWFGDEMKRFNGEVPGDDEEFLSCIYPTSQGMTNAWNGNAIVAHFAFFTQREVLDRQNILEQYGKCLHCWWRSDENMAHIHYEIQKIMQDIAYRENELLLTPSPYKRAVVAKTLRSRIKKIVPTAMLNFVERRRNRLYANACHIVNEENV